MKLKQLQELTVDYQETITQNGYDADGNQTPVKMFNSILWNEVIVPMFTDPEHDVAVTGFLHDFESVNPDDCTKWGKLFSRIENKISQIIGEDYSFEGTDDYDRLVELFSIVSPQYV